MLLCETYFSRVYIHKCILFCLALKCTFNVKYHDKVNNLYYCYNNVMKKAMIYCGSLDYINNILCVILMN